MIILLFAHKIISQEWSPNYYHPVQDTHRPQTKHAVKELPKLNLKGSESVIDIGCGDGDITAYIANHCLLNGSIHGIDISKPMIDTAQQKHVLRNTTFECASLLNYQPTKLYDIAVCFWVLFLFEDYATALKNVISCLKPGGKALICHIIDPGTPFFQIVKKTVTTDQMPIHLPELETIIGAVRTLPVTIDSLEVKYNYDYYTTFEEFITAMQKIPIFSEFLKTNNGSINHDLLRCYPQQPDGSVRDFSHVVVLVLEKK